MKIHVLTFLAAAIITTEGCSLAGDQPPEMSMEEKFYKAPVVVYAKYESLEDFKVQDTTVKNAHLTLKCVFKSPSTITEGTIKIFQYQPKNSCSGTTIEVGMEYVFSLQKSTERNETDMYALYEGQALERAAYKVEGNLLNTTANVCGLEDFTVASGCSDSCCPVIPDPDATPCVKSAATVIASFSKVLAFFLLLVFGIFV